MQVICSTLFLPETKSSCFSSTCSYEKSETIPYQTKALRALELPRTLIDQLEQQPKVVSKDNGNEYADLATYLKDKGIGHEGSVSDWDVNTLAVLEPAVQDVKKRFTRVMARTKAERF